MNPYMQQTTVHDTYIIHPQLQDCLASWWAGLALEYHAHAERLDDVDHQVVLRPKAEDILWQPKPSAENLVPSED